jgi:hypothetical protein
VGLKPSTQVEYEKSIDISVVVEYLFDLVVFVLLSAAGLDYLLDEAFRSPFFESV